MKFLAKIFLPVFFLSGGAMAQDIPYMDGSLNYLKKGSNLLEKGANTKALKALEKGLSKADEDSAAFYPYLARVNNNLKNYQDAETYYALAYQSNESEEVGKAYAEVLAMNGAHNKAEEVLADIASKNKVVESRKEGFARVSSLMDDRKLYKVDTVSFNTACGDLYAGMIGEATYVSSNRNSRIFGLVNERDGGGFSDLYEISASVASPKRVKELSNRLHQGPFYYAAATGELFLTENHKPSLSNKAKDEISRLKIGVYRQAEDGTWKYASDLPVNNESYSVGHPAYDEVNERLYFASDMEGGQGQNDIYFIQRNGDSWSEPKPVTSVNTVADEMYPFIDVPNNTLYFASNGYEGLGGLDIYKVNLNGGKVVNLGAPVNSFKDDFGFYMAKGEKGYFVSNRDGGKGNDDIYAFEFQLVTLMAEIKNAPDLGPDIIGVESTSGAYTETIVKDNSLELLGAENQDYEFSVDAEGYEPFTKKVKLTESLDGTTIALSLTKKEEKPDKSAVFVKVDNVSEKKIYKVIDNQFVEVEDTPENVAETFSIENVFFEFDSDQPNAAADVVNKIASVMNDFESINLEIIAYADSRGSQAYNERLARRRANSVAQMLQQKGIDKDRISIEAIGEHVVHNDCVEGADCSEKEHAINRRVEFKLK